MKKECLKDSLCYLVGSIDRAKDSGIGWRKKIISMSHNKGLKIKFLDPTNKVVGLQSEVNEEQLKIKNLKREGKWDELSEFMHIIVRSDLRCIDLSDFIIFYLDADVHICGSYFELITALQEKKPYFIIVPSGKSKTPSWLFGICKHENIYSSLEEVVERLVKINSGEISSDRWVLFREQIKNL